MKGEELKNLIVDKGFVLADLAKKLGISPQLLNRRLSVKSVKLDFIKEIERALSVQLVEPQQKEDTLSSLIKLLQKKDEQIDRLIRLLEEERDNGDGGYKKANVG